MKTENAIAGAVLFLAIGFLVADYLAYRFAKVHGTIKYGGVFSNGPKAGEPIAH
jgi:hypothetical protein